MHDVFISYAGEDRAHAVQLARALEARGLSVWWDRQIPAGVATGAYELQIGRIH